MILASDKTSLEYTDEYEVNGYGSYNRKRFLGRLFVDLAGDNSTPLHYACKTGHWRIIEELLSAGADWLRKDNNEKVPRDFLHKDVDEYTIEKYDGLCLTLNEVKQLKEKEERERLERKKEEQERLLREKEIQELKEREEKEGQEQQKIETQQVDGKQISIS